MVHVGMIFSIKSYTPGITRAHTQTNRHAHKTQIHVYIHTHKIVPAARRASGGRKCSMKTQVVRRPRSPACVCTCVCVCIFVCESVDACSIHTYKHGPNPTTPKRTNTSRHHPPVRHRPNSAFPFPPPPTAPATAPATDGDSSSDDDDDEDVESTIPLSISPSPSSNHAGGGRSPRATNAPANALTVGQSCISP